MNINPENKDTLSGSLFTSGNSPPANPVGYNGSPLAAFKMEYKIVQLAHQSGDFNETEARLIEITLNEYASDGWTLKCTQFLPWVVEEEDNPQEYIGWGYLVLFLKRKTKV
jgi:hypothetical protein